MEQKIPKIDETVIKRLIKREYPQEESDVIESILKKYKSETEAGQNRIYASLLKLSGRNLEALKKLVEKANYDYRDIIALSEYPNYSKRAFDNTLSEKEKRQLIDSDWFQYEHWLNG